MRDFLETVQNFFLLRNAKSREIPLPSAKLSLSLSLVVEGRESYFFVNINFRNKRRRGRTRRANLRVNFRRASNRVVAFRLNIFNVTVSRISRNYINTARPSGIRTASISNGEIHLLEQKTNISGVQSVARQRDATLYRRVESSEHPNPMIYIALGWGDATHLGCKRVNAN